MKQQLNLSLQQDFRFKLLQVREASEEKADDPESVYELMKEEAKADRECFWVLHLNARLKIIEKELVSMGVLNASLAHPREVFKKAIINGASAIITVHNHPSGSLQPSEDDIENWARLTKAGELLGIPVQDHLIISTKGFYSHTQSSKKHGQGGLDVTVKESKASYRTKTFQVVCHGKVISKHVSFYRAQEYIPVLFSQDRIDNSYTIEPIRPMRMKERDETRQSKQCQKCGGFIQEGFKDAYARKQNDDVVIIKLYCFLCPKCGDRYTENYQEKITRMGLKAYGKGAETMKRPPVLSGEIKDEYGDVESACTVTTPYELKRWFEEHGVNFYDRRLKVNGTDYTYQRKESKTDEQGN